MKTLIWSLPLLITSSLSLLSYPLFFPDNALTVELADGTVAFTRSPRLLNVVTTYDTIRNWYAKYYFTVEIPQETGEPLGSVEIELRQGSDRITYRLDETVAFIGSRNNPQEKLTVAANLVDNNPNLLQITFEKPVPPGQTITIALKPRQNPGYSGYYLFGVTAFPAGEKPRGMYLGVGRLYFRGSDWSW